MKSNKGISLIIMIIIILLITAIGGAGGYFLFKNNSSDSKSQNDNNSDTAYETNPKEDNKKTGLYAVDYDYASLKEGIDYSNMRVRHEYSSEIYRLNELPNEYWKDKKISSSDISKNEFQESNSRYSHSFFETVSNKYIIFNLDEKSTVNEAYNKGWYALTRFKIFNSGEDYDYKDKIGKFNAIIKGMGKPYCVIRSEKNTRNENELNNLIFLIYKEKDKDVFYVIEYYDNLYNGTESLDVLEVYWIASEDMLRAYLKDNMGSNNVKSYTQSYIFQNGKNLIN